MQPIIDSQPAPFANFGASILSKVVRQNLEGQLLPDDRMDSRAMLHDHCPLTPGVYGWIDRNDQLCYVGKSKSLRKRLLSYFAKTPSDPKMGRIVRHSHRLVWEPVSHELLALIREQELIYRWRPDFNSQGQPHRRQPAFIGIGGTSAPRAMFFRSPRPDAGLLVGPIAGTGRLKAAVEAINQAFHLRDCPDKTRFHFNDQQSLFDDPASAKCIRFELGTCPAPCAARCSRSTYAANVQAAMRFLRLEDLSVLDRMAAAMAAASKKQHFERAAILRDQLNLLSWLSVKLTSLQESRETLNGVLPVTGFGSRHLWLVLRGGRLVGSAARPRSAARADVAIRTLERIAAQSQTPPSNTMEMNFQLMIIAWLRRDRAMQRQFLSFDDALEHCSAVKRGRKGSLAKVA